MPTKQTLETANFSEYLGQHLAMRDLLPKKSGMQDDRRRHARFNAKQYGEVFPLDSRLLQIGGPIVVQVTDVSLGGMGFVSSQQIGANYIYVKLRISQQSIDCVAQILRRQQAGIALFNHAFGSRFIDRMPATLD